MPELSRDDIERIKEEKRRIEEDIKRKWLYIGVVVIKNHHVKDCRCDDCLTNPSPFVPFPEEYKRFVDGLFKAIRE